MSSSEVRAQSAALLAIGDEVLRGEVANSNAAFLSGHLFEAGIDLREHVVVSDDPTAIRSVLVRLRAEVDVVIATGGLGPTEDDRTVDTVADLLGVGTAADEPSLEAMKKRFATHGFELTPNNLRQVRIPTGAQALPNAAGIAPGFRISLGGAEGYFLPGVPREMEKMFIDHVAPRLASRMTEMGTPPPAVRTWHVYGMGESHIDHRLAGLLTGIEGATLHFRTSNPENHVKVVVRDRNLERGRATLEKIDLELRKRIGPGIYAVDGDKRDYEMGSAALMFGAMDVPNACYVPGLRTYGVRNAGARCVSAARAPAAPPARRPRPRRAWPGQRRASRSSGSTSAAPWP